MWYMASVEVPPSTSETQPVVEEIPLTLGTIERVLVGFPYGCAGLVHVTLHDKGWQILPWTLGESLAWDDYMFDLQLHYPLVSEPYTVIVRAWNQDDSYPHTVFVGIGLTEGQPDDSFLNFLRALKEVA